METHPVKLDGNWKEGWALDLHTTSSIYLGADQFGHDQWDTKRPPIAEELYLLKYRHENKHVEVIAKTANEFLRQFQNQWGIDCIIPIPPSDTTRTFQPVYEIAKVFGKLSGIPVWFDTLKKTKSTSQLKGIEDPDDRKKILKDAFSMNYNALAWKSVLIFDDLYRSGETLHYACKVAKEIGNAKKVYVLTITKTRSKR